MNAARTAMPWAVGVDPDAVSAFVASLHDAGLEVHGFQLSRHGLICAQGSWEPYNAERPRLLYSLSKTFTATAWALAEAEGLVERERPLMDYWPHVAVAGPRARRWTAQHLLTMASGHSRDVFSEGPGATATAGSGDVDAVSWCFAQEPDREPGSLFVYNQLCTYLLSATLQQVTAQPLTDFLSSRLLEPLGAGSAAWQADNRGRELGFTGLYTNLDTMWRLGQLYLNDGVWRGRRLLPQGWVAQATSQQITTDHPEPDGSLRRPDWACGYGYQVWQARHGYRGDGAFGQFIIVLPEVDAVVAIISGLLDMQAVLDRVWAHLLPGLRGEPQPTDGIGPQRWDLFYAPVGGAGQGGTFTSPTSTYLHEGLGAWPVPVRSLTVQPAAVGEWSLMLDDGLSVSHMVAGNGVWRAGAMRGREGSVSVAASAGWQGGQFVAHLRLVETPHTVLLTGDPGTGNLVARWSVPPLRGSSIWHFGRSKS